MSNRIYKTKKQVEKAVYGAPLPIPEGMVRPVFAPMENPDYNEKNVFYEDEKMVVLHAPVCDSAKLFEALNHESCESEAYLSKLLARKKEDPMLIVSLDTEYQEFKTLVRAEADEDTDGETLSVTKETVVEMGYREVLSYQIAGYYNGQIVRFIFFSKTKELLSTDDILKVLCSALSVKALRYPIPKGKNGKKNLDVDILAYNALADVTTFRDFPDIAFSLVKSADLISRESYFTRFSKNNAYYYDCKIRILGVMNHVPGGLKELGAALNLPKIVLDDGVISNMKAFRSDHFQQFLDYGINDSDICLLWYLLNFKDMQIPVSAPSLGAKIIEDAIAGDIADEKARGDAVLAWRGLKIHKRLTTSAWHNRPCYVKIGEEPVSTTAERLLLDATNAYCGGMNQSMIQGYYDCETFDYDLCGCYPTAGSLLRDPDYMADCTEELIYKCEITMDLVEKYDYLTYGFGDVKFEFPRNVKFPCIAISDENRGLIFPRTSDYYVYTTWPEVRCAILMGARVYANEFRLYASVTDENGDDVYTLRRAYKKMTVFRKLAKQKYATKENKKPIQERVWKLAGSGAYGKLGQNVKAKKARDVRYDKTVDMEPSSITSPPHAAYITALPRVLLCSVMQQLADRGYKSFSVTTDGFITNAPLEVLEACDGHGLIPLFKQSREYLVGDPKVWERKHRQNHLLNITTRVNVGFDDPETGLVNPGENVCAHVGFKSPKRTEAEKEVLSDGALFIQKYLYGGKNGVVVENMILPNLNDVVRRDRDYVGSIATCTLKYNFDFKRKPDFSTMQEIGFDFRGEEHSILNFETIPYENFDEYERYRDSKNRFRAIRTLQDYTNVFMGSYEQSAKLPTLDAQIKAAIYSIRTTASKRMILDRVIEKYNLEYVLAVIQGTIRKSLDAFMKKRPQEEWLKGIETYTAEFLKKSNWSNYARQERFNQSNHLGYAEWVERAIMFRLNEMLNRE